MSLSALENILLSPHSTNAPFEIPPRQGGEEDRKKGSSRMPSCISELSYYSLKRHSYLCFVKLQLRLYPRYRINFRSLHPIHQHGIQWRISDRLRPLGRQGRHRNWYANHPFPSISHLALPPANFRSASEQAPRPALASQQPTSSSLKAVKSWPPT